MFSLVPDREYEVIRRRTCAMPNIHNRQTRKKPGLCAHGSSPGQCQPIRRNSAYLAKNKLTKQYQCKTSSYPVVKTLKRLKVKLVPGSSDIHVMNKGENILHRAGTLGGGNGRRTKTLFQSETLATIRISEKLGFLRARMRQLDERHKQSFVKNGPRLSIS